MCSHVKCAVCWTLIGCMGYTTYPNGGKKQTRPWARQSDKSVRGHIVPPASGLCSYGDQVVECFLWVSLPSIVWYWKWKRSRVGGAKWVCGLFIYTYAVFKYSKYCMSTDTCWMLVVLKLLFSMESYTLECVGMYTMHDRIYLKEVMWLEGNYFYISTQM